MLRLARRCTPCQGGYREFLSIESKNWSLNYKHWE
jgi:hypothetical protein